MKNPLWFAICLISFLFPGVSLQAVEIAPRISDREIIESLAELKAGQTSIDQRFEQVDQRFEQQQTSIDQRFEQLQTSLDQRFEQVDQRFEQVDQRFEQLQTSLDQRFEQVDQRFEQLQTSIDQRFEQQQTSIDQRFEQADQRFEQLQQSLDQRFDQLDQRFAYQENLTLVLIAGVLGLIAFIIWDRKTALRPLEKKLDKLEQDLQHDLELQNPEGSRLTRLIHALRELAEHDPKVAETLKAYSLL